MDDYQELFDALKDEGAEVLGDGRIGFDADGYGTLTLQDPSTMSPTIGGGGGWQHPYVSFNRTDQSALIYGGGAALVAVICGLPAVGLVACGVAGTIVAIAATYVNAYGRCSVAYPNLRVYVRTMWVGGCYK